MKILFAGNKERGARCLEALLAQGHQIVGVITHPSAGRLPAKGRLVDLARELRLPVFHPENVNDSPVLENLRQLQPELTVLAGYGPIVKTEFLALAPKGCLNLHGGKLPRYRGSSPMNWALIKGEKEFTLSIIQVDHGVDTGDVLLEKSFPIRPEDTIAELDRKANETFPQLLVEAVTQVERGGLRPRKQDSDQAGDFPLRFPDDGFIVWDLYTAEQIHNRIRALSDPYPGAYTFHKHRKVKLSASRLTEQPVHSEAGRIYRISDSSLLVGASDRCLWIDRAAFEDTGESVVPAVSRYDKFPTIRDAVAAFAGPQGKK